ncbi:MAG TPA: methyltransferase domain-containing protein [Rhizomicrobium sp.]|nr:methyltransferase domain-containing protein [Rhizomicrobium sp.]
MSEPDVYLLGRSRAEEERLRMQVQELSGEADWLLDQLHILPGASAIDIGCGPQGVLDLLADRVGPQGNVVGLERSEGFVASARAFVADRKLANVKVVQGDAKATNLPRGSFDVVHARLVLVNVPQPWLVIEEMVALAKPGGVVVSHEADYLPHCCDPPSPAWDRLFEILAAFSGAKGIDLFVGRKTHRLLRDAGIVDVQVRPVVHVYPHGHNRRSIFLDFIRNIRDVAIKEGFAEEGELDVLMAELRQHLDDPGTQVISHLFFQAWGRKP